MAQYSEKDLLRLKMLREAQKERSKLSGYTSNWTLNKLENMQYYLDLNNFFKYYALARGTSRGVTGLPHSVSQRVLNSGTKRLEWRNIILVADAFGILPEMLVDEDYYFSKCGMAGYRVMFAAYRKGVSLAELTYCAGQSDNPAYQYSWYHLWYMFFKGSFTIQKNMNIQHLTTILKLCHERLDVPIGSLLGKQLHTKATHTGFYGELTELLMGLDNRGCALVAGITKAVREHGWKWRQRGKRVKREANETLKKDVNTLLEWFCDGKKETE